MGFFIGTSVQEYNGRYIAAATCWFAGTPVFSTHGMTLPYMKEKLLSVVFTQSDQEIRAINAASQRTLEKLFIKRIIRLPKDPNNDVTLLVPPYLKKNQFIYPHQPDSKHWLVRGAKRALAEWIGAQNARKPKRRKRTSTTAR